VAGMLARDSWCRALGCLCRRPPLGCRPWRGSMPPPAPWKRANARFLSCCTPCECMRVSACECVCVRAYASSCTGCASWLTGEEHVEPTLNTARWGGAGAAVRHHDFVCLYGPRHSRRHPRVPGRAPFLSGLRVLSHFPCRACYRVVGSMCCAVDVWAFALVCAHARPHGPFLCGPLTPLPTQPLNVSSRDVHQGNETVLLLGIVCMMLSVAIALLFLPPLVMHKYVGPCVSLRACSLPFYTFARGVRATLSRALAC
jgi:hypothetical protein